LLILFFKFDVQVFDLKHNFLLGGRSCVERRKAASGKNPARR
jgi:hypothetical protein